MTVSPVSDCSEGGDGERLLIDHVDRRDFVDRDRAAGTGLVVTAEREIEGAWRHDFKVPLPSRWHCAWVIGRERAEARRSTAVFRGDRHVRRRPLVERPEPLGRAMTMTHHSQGLREGTYAWRFSEASTYPVGDPLKFLAAAVIARWVEDRQKGVGEPEIGEEWATMAEVPVAVARNGAGGSVSMYSSPPNGWAKAGSQEDAMERATMELAQDLKQQFRDRDELYRDIDAVLFGELPVEIPEAYRKTAVEVRSPLALHIANTVTAALSRESDERGVQADRLRRRVPAEQHAPGAVLRGELEAPGAGEQASVAPAVHEQPGVQGRGHPEDGRALQDGVGRLRREEQRSSRRS